MPSTLLEQLIAYARDVPESDADSRAHQALYAPYPDNAAIICLDTALSIRNNRVRAVLPRMKAFAADYPDVTTLSALKEMIDEVGIDGFGEVWNFRAKHRIEMAYALCEWFMAYRDEHGCSSDVEAIQHWAANVDVTAKRTTGVKGIGLSATQHLRMIAGHPTVPAGDYLSIGIEQLFGGRIPTAEAIVLVEQASERTGRPQWDLCSALWSVYSCKNE